MKGFLNVFWIGYFPITRVMKGFFNVFWLAVRLNIDGSRIWNIDGFYEMFRNQFRNSIRSEINLTIPNDVKVFRLSQALLYVDAKWVKNQVQVGLTARSEYGSVLFAKSCTIHPRSLIPKYYLKPERGDMVFAELCAFAYGVLCGIELRIPKFDVITDSQLVKKFLTSNPTEHYNRSDHQFLAVSGKCLWFSSSALGFGTISWIRSEENYITDSLTKVRHSELRKGKKEYKKFWKMVRADIPNFKATLAIQLARVYGDNVKNEVILTKGSNYEVLVARAFSIMEKKLVLTAPTPVLAPVLGNPFNAIITTLPKPGGGEFGKFYSLPALNDPRVVKLPYSIRILLESAIRNCDGFQVTKDDVEKIIDWENSAPKLTEILFKPARVLLQDFTGVPVVVDLAAMRDAMKNLNIDANKINPLVPVDFVIDHSVQINVARSENAVQANMELEFQRNQEIFGFLKWGSTAFRNMLVVPPGSGIVHQVNLEYLGRVVFNTNGLLYPDSVVGTDSLTTMIDGLGVAGWGVGGIEAVATMLGQPMSMVLPGVVGFKMTGNLRDGVTATDLVLTVTQMLRKHGVVGKFVEFYGQGMSQLSLADRATIANMSPEYGATMGFFPVDHVTLDYLKLIGRADDTVSMIEHYLRANNMFVDYNEPQVERVYSSYLELDLAEVEPCMSGPKRPHDRVPLKDMKADWHGCLDNKVGFKGFAIPKDDQSKVVKFSFHGQPAELKHGSVVIAAITSYTNTSNPSVMLGAAVVAKKACELGLEVKPWVKTSLAPGSGVVTKYLQKSGLQKYLDQQGFKHVDYGRTTFIGNSSDLDESVSAAISENDIVAAAVLSGNRNFEGRVHPLTRANYLASPPLVVAYALAGTVDIDFENEPIGTGNDGKSVYFRDIWPSNEEIAQVVQSSVRPDMFKTTYEAITKGNPMWNSLEVPEGSLYQWDPESTYIHDPPYFKHMTFDPPGPHGVKAAYCLLYFGDGITTDHISPAGSIHRDSPAAKYLVEHGVDRKDFNSYGSHSGNDEVMARGTFANIRIVNKLLNGEVGPKTIHIPTGEKLYVFDAATRYKEAGHDTIIIAGAEYGSGSSRDWAAKGPMLQGVKAVIAKSFERIHRSNLVGMGVIPLCFKAGEDADTLGLTGHERYTIDLPSKVSELRPGQDVTVVTDSGKSFTCTVRFDTEVELAYFDHGGILPYVIRQLMRQ